MKKRLSVPPTKSALLQVDRQVRFLEQGQQMLEKKRDLLTRLVYERLAQYRELRAQTTRELAEAYHWLGIVQMRMGGQMLRQSSVGLKLPWRPEGGGPLQRRRRIPERLGRAAAAASRSA